MRILPRPRSLVGLILLGFVLVALPLGVAVVRAVINVERLEQRSRALLEQGVLVARHGESLDEQLPAIVRNARQFQVLGDPDLRQIALQRLERFLETLDELEALPVAETTESRIRKLRENADAISAALKEQAPQSEALASALSRFDALSQLTGEINSEGQAYIDREFRALQKATVDTRRMLALQSALVIPAALVLALVFTALINRPVRQLQAAIRRLGRGEFEAPVTVSGPPELQAVSRRLDWLRQRLKELEEEKSRFLRHMSHELKTPLASLHEGTELLLDGSTGELLPTQREVAELLRANAVELQQMILNLLDFSAWQERTARLNTTEFDMAALARSVGDQHRLAMAARGVRLRVSGEPTPVHGDRDKLRTALDNLVSNAVKFSPEGGQIELGIRRDDDWAIIEIRDEGPGVPQPDRERIFEPFFQGRIPHAGPVRGTGIGLSVVKECINAHGGDIDLLDSARGAHFRIRLPTARAA